MTPTLKYQGLVVGANHLVIGLTMYGPEKSWVRFSQALVPYVDLASAELLEAARRADLAQRVSPGETPLF